MSTKGEATKAYIVKEALTLFSQKGFNNVTMTDICEACDLSRGGLYRHFGSTKDIFIEILESDNNDIEESINQALLHGLSAKKLLSSFFDLQKKDIASDKERIEVAVYEFCTAYPEHKDYFNKRFDDAVHIFYLLIEYGQKRNEFKKGDASTMAKHIVFYLEGLKMSAPYVSLDEEFLDNQFAILEDMIM